MCYRVITVDFGKDWILKTNQTSSCHFTALLRIVAIHMNHLWLQLAATQVILICFYEHSYFSVIYLHPEQLWDVVEKESQILIVQVTNVQ